MSAGRRKIREGVVVSDKMDKTVVVIVARLVRHGKYHKYLTQRVRYKAHDEKNQCRVGDRVRIFPDKPLTKKPAETRMGKGKGSPEIWVAVVKPGRMLFEMEGVDSANAKEALRLAAAKLSLATQPRERRHTGAAA